MVKSLSEWTLSVFLDILRRAEVWPGEATGEKKGEEKRFQLSHHVMKV